MAKKATNKKENLPMEEVLWKACDALRGSIEPSEYKHVVLSLIFLKYAGFHFDKRRREIINDGLEDFVDSVEFYEPRMCFIFRKQRVGHISRRTRSSPMSLQSWIRHFLTSRKKTNLCVVHYLTIIIVRWE